MVVEAVTWAALPREVCELARTYGYAVDGAPVQVVDGAAEACDAAFEAAREQIYRAQWTWRSEREHQTGVTIQVRDEADRLRQTVRELQLLLHAAREQAREARENLAAQHRARLEALTTKLQRVSDARRATVQQRDEIRTANQKLRKQLQIAVQARADAAREPELLRQQLEVAAHERASLRAAAAEARANWQKARDDVAVLGASLQATRQHLDARTEAVRKLRFTLSTARERHRVVRGRTERLDARVRHLKAALERRDEEVRYRLGDALIRALRPSKDTLRLPGRLVGLVMEGVKRRRARRSGAATGPTAPGTVPASLPTPSPTSSREGSAATPGTDAAKPVETIVREASKPLTAVVPAERNNGNGLATVPLPVPVGERGALPARNRGRSARWGARGYLFFCVNGAGLGHVTRSLAIARRIRRLEPEAPIYFLSSSQALDVISREGMVAYHIPPHSRYGDHLRSSEWSTLLQQQIQLIADTHHPAVFVYDGVFPYRGVLDAIQECRFVHAAMVLRLRHKHNRLPEMAEKLSVFNEVIFPGEAGVSGGVEELAPPELAALSCRMVDPIVYLDREELLPREQVRAMWNVPPNKKLVYVQLGAGNINDIQALSEQILAVLSELEDIVVLLAESPIAERAHNGRDNVHVLRHYPNSLYCKGFDLAITAVGYNTFHEQMHFGVPSVLIPNQETKTDDQTGRAMTAHRALAAITVLRLESLAEAIALGLTDAVASTMREKALALVPANGALAAAQCLVEASQPAPGLAVV
jgi:UDP:flavonoid glycosyltransferase YjiC (YdhE family)